jgi:2-polyprenyl-3-methyl-5-hydroxy-6-metoxy-1,4-benzoquinol methylase
MPHRAEDDWEALARREPHYAVITDERFLAERLDEEALQRFFASGEGDVAHLFSLAEGYAGQPLKPEIALDFGCGVGRLTLALAHRAGRVIGVDAAPTMLAIAARHRDTAGLDNVELVASLDGIDDSSIDFICSLIVFQHIPVRAGEQILRQLLAHLRPGGVAALHFALHRPGGTLKRAARRIRGALPLLHKLLQTLQGDALRLPYMQMNTYDRPRLESIVREAGCRAPAWASFDQQEIGGAILLTEKLGGAPGVQ